MRAGNAASFLVVVLIVTACGLAASSFSPEHHAALHKASATNFRIGRGIYDITGPAAEGIRYILLYIPFSDYLAKRA